LSIFLNGKKDPHLFGSVGFLLYLCEMEPISVKYPDSSLSDLTNPCAEIFVDYGMIDDLYKKMHEMAMNRLHAERHRYKMGGDEGVHSIVKNTEEYGN